MRLAGISALALATCLIASCDSDSADNSDAFFIAFTKSVEIITTLNSTACGGNPEYMTGHTNYVARFEAVDGATGYSGRVLLKDDSYGASMELNEIEDEANGNLLYTLGVGPIEIFETCNQATSLAHQQSRLAFMDTIGHQGVEITPIF